MTNYKYGWSISLLVSWQESIQQGAHVVLATASPGGTPHAIVVESLGLLNDKLLLGACQMHTTLENLKVNPKAAIVATGTHHKKEYFRIKGPVALSTAGRVFETATARNQGPKVKVAILLDIEEVFDLDKQRRVL